MGGFERLVHSLVLHLDRSLFSPSIVGRGASPPFREMRKIGISCLNGGKKGFR